MGVSYTIEERRLQGRIGRETVLTASFDASYNAGGEALTASDAGLDEYGEVAVRETVTESGYVVGYDESAGVLKVYEGGGAGATLQEVAGGTDLSTETVRLLVRGSGTA
ncbi:hypothetical protein [Halostella sp. PRR32]|uniref:hypothetical protein n=1 Tax=Halostella sp. PRR32 TaxID=3098147 RepID=UPI002B1D9C17|nr:hypothetical protein [Halostella sp. PRR32]